MPKPPRPPKLQKTMPPTYEKAEVDGHPSLKENNFSLNGDSATSYQQSLQKLEDLGKEELALIVQDMKTYIVRKAVLLGKSILELRLLPRNLLRKLRLLRTKTLTTNLLMRICLKMIL